MRVLHSVIGVQPTISQIEIIAGGVNLSRSCEDKYIGHVQHLLPLDLEYVLDPRGSDTISRIRTQPYDLFVLDLSTREDLGRVKAYLDILVGSFYKTINGTNPLYENFGPVMALLGKRQTVKEVVRAYYELYKERGYYEYDSFRERFCGILYNCFPPVLYDIDSAKITYGNEYRLWLPRGVNLRLEKPASVFVNLSPTEKGVLQQHV